METPQFLKGRESVWRELYENTLLLLEKEKELKTRAIANLKPQIENEESIKVQHITIGNLMDEKALERNLKEAANASFKRLLTGVMNISNLSAEERLRALRHEYKDIWERIKNN